MDIAFHSVSLPSEPATTLVANLMAEMDERYPGEAPGVPSDPRHFESPRGRFLVVLLDGVAAGCGGVRRHDDKTAEIKRMYVEPWARGKGVSRKLLAALEDVARELGYLRVRLETGTAQPEALGLYGTSGYGEIPPYGEFRHSPLSVCFEKALL